MHFTVGFPGEEGFLGRECNSPECRRYFKVLRDSILTEMYCPYCGEQFSNDELWTRDQLDYATQKVKQEALHLAEKEVREMIRRAFDGKSGWTFKPAPPAQRKPDLPPPPEKRVDSELLCPGVRRAFPG